MSTPPPDARATARQIAAQQVLAAMEPHKANPEAQMAAAVDLVASLTADLAAARQVYKANECIICHGDSVADSKATICDWHYGKAVQGEADAEAELAEAEQALAEARQERDAAIADATDYIAQVQRAERAEAELAQARQAADNLVRNAEAWKLAYEVERQAKSEALQARDAAHAQIADLQDILNQRQARLEAIEQALAEARKESEWRGEKLQSVAKFAARTALLEAADAAQEEFGWTHPGVGAWLRSRAGDVK